MQTVLNESVDQNLLIDGRMSRRRFVGTATAAALAASAARAEEPAAKHNEEGAAHMDYTAVRGFNYQPSYGSSGLELWQKFDAALVDAEIGRGRAFFPRMNALRIWLSWDSFKRNPKRCGDNFETLLSIAHKHGATVMPVLFNRWHDAALDYGGIYLDHFLPRSSWVQQPDMFTPYLEAIVGKHAADARVFAWDLCNEPFAYGRPPEEIPEIVKAEYAWLEDVHRRCKKLGAKAPITVGIHPGHGRKGIEQIEPLSDLLSIHPYWTGPKHDKAAYERLLDEYVDFAGKVQKPVVASETCWGEIDDARRVEIIRYTLGELKKRRIGWLAYLLHHSLIADAHRPEFGPLSGPGNLAFIEADGTLRPGHEIFNEF
ncbi:MAG: hypothetical protein ABSE73_27420 [Planctomycetota bacterium]